MQGLLENKGKNMHALIRQTEPSASQYKHMLFSLSCDSQEEMFAVLTIILCEATEMKQLCVCFRRLGVNRTHVPQGSRTKGAAAVMFGMACTGTNAPKSPRFCGFSSSSCFESRRAAKVFSADLWRRN